MERIVQLLKDLEAVHSPSGYTGAVMNRFLGSLLGTVIAVTGLVIWILIPAWAGRRAFERRDF